MRREAETITRVLSKRFKPLAFMVGYNNEGVIVYVRVKNQEKSIRAFIKKNFIQQKIQVEYIGQVSLL